MRALVRMDEKERAGLFSDVLFAKGIENRVDESREGGYVVWVHDENHLDEANDLLERFEDNPDDPSFRAVRGTAEAKRKEREKEERQARKRNIDMRKRWQSQRGVGRLTLGLIIVSVGVTLIAGFGRNAAIKNALFIWPPLIGAPEAGIEYLLETLELWRLITPIFVHLGFLHLLFNMWWLKDFGTVIENRHSTGMLAAMVLVMGILSNAGQALLEQANFGGMSGVIYGLFGYLWIRGKLDPQSGFVLQRSTVIILIGWMLLGFSGFMRMANIAHLGGLVVGMAWGAIAALRARSKRR